MKQPAGPYETETIPVRILLPAFLTVALFVGTIFMLILPKMEARMMADKRQMIRELTETAWSILDAHHQREASGVMSREQAQADATRLLRELRYGPENKDYYWINDMHPVLIMHPYRRDLEGEDISEYSDPNGKKLFMETVRIVQQSGSGYVDYQWQWKDNPLRIVPKISYVKGFQPWGWIIGTGIYVEDVRAEIDAITRRIGWVSVGILVVIAALSIFNIGQNAAADRRRREALAGLRASEERYRLLAETAREFILVCDQQGRIVYVNRSFLSAGGFTAQEVIQKPVFDLLPAESDEFQRAEMRLRLTADCPHDLFETSFLTMSGQHIPVEVAVAPLVREGRIVDVLITARDMTERKRAQEEAQLHREQLYQADKMATLGTLVSGVAHEINNPISSIMLNTPILEKFWQAALPVLDEYRERGGELAIGQMGYDHLRQRLPQLLSDIGEGARRVKTIVGDLKDFARKEPQHMEDRIEINAVASKAVSLVSNLIKKSTQHFQTVFGQYIPLFRGNEQKVEQVIINLLVNACQALPDPHRAISLHTDFDTHTGRVLIEVRDQGSGMPEEILNRIKDPFFTTKRESGGTGLGLAIAERIVEDHAGKMIFSSRPGQGTTVQVFFPAINEIGSVYK